jgi:DNA-binding CsgD family transcriptional regulator
VPHLGDKDVASLLALVAESHALLDIADFRAGILPLMRRAVPCLVATYNELEPGTGRAVALVDPPGAMSFDDPDALLARVGPSNPLVSHYASTRDGRARKISDFITQRELHQTALWREAFRPLGIEYQIAFTLPSQPSVVIGIALNGTESDFSERDRALLDLARPQLIQAYRTAQIHTEMRARLAVLDRGLEAAGQAAVVLRPDGHVEAASREAERMLASAFGSRSVRSEPLPPELAHWVDERRAARPVADHLPLIVPAGEDRLVIRFVRRLQAAERDVLLLERSIDPLSAGSLRALGLTARESAVLRLAALGETKDVIATQLTISPATVKKHFENVNRKLGVHSRAEAIATAWAGAETKAISGSREMPTG